MNNDPNWPDMRGASQAVVDLLLSRAGDDVPVSWAIATLGCALTQFLGALPQQRRRAELERWLSNIRKGVQAAERAGVWNR